MAGEFQDGRNFDSGWRVSQHLHAISTNWSISRGLCRPSARWPWFLSYMRAGDFDWALWCADGTQSRGTGRHFGAIEHYGLLNETWDGPAADGAMLRALQPLQQATQGPGITQATDPWEPPNSSLSAEQFAEQFAG